MGIGTAKLIHAFAVGASNWDTPAQPVQRHLT
jgi:hypothetical protein